MVHARGMGIAIDLAVYYVAVQAPLGASLAIQQLYEKRKC